MIRWKHFVVALATFLSTSQAKCPGGQAVPNSSDGPTEQLRGGKTQDFTCVDGSKTTWECGTDDVWIEGDACDAASGGGDKPPKEKAPKECHLIPKKAKCEKLPDQCTWVLFQGCKDKTGAHCDGCDDGIDARGPAELCPLYPSGPKCRRAHIGCVWLDFTRWGDQTDGSYVGRQKDKGQGCCVSARIPNADDSTEGGDRIRSRDVDFHDLPDENRLDHMRGLGFRVTSCEDGDCDVVDRKVIDWDAVQATDFCDKGEVPTCEEMVRYDKNEDAVPSRSLCVSRKDCIWVGEGDLAGTVTPGCKSQCDPELCSGYHIKPCRKCAGCAWDADRKRCRSADEVKGDCETKKNRQKCQRAGVKGAKNNREFVCTWDIIAQTCCSTDAAISSNPGKCSADSGGADANGCSRINQLDRAGEDKQGICVQAKCLWHEKDETCHGMVHLGTAVKCEDLKNGHCRKHNEMQTRAGCYCQLVQGKCVEHPTNQDKDFGECFDGAGGGVTSDFEYLVQNDGNCKDGDAIVSPEECRQAAKFMQNHEDAGERLTFSGEAFYDKHDDDPKYPYGCYQFYIPNVPQVFGFSWNGNDTDGSDPSTRRVCRK